MSRKIKSIRKNYISKRTFVIVVAILLIGGLAYMIYRNTQNSSDTAMLDGNTNNEGRNTNLGPANDQNKAATDQSKDDIAKNQGNNPVPNGKKEVEPVITFAGVRNGNAEVRSYIGEVYESSGKCTVSFTKGSSKITRTVEGIKDVTYTRCDRVVVALNEFKSSGSWTVLVSYNSPTASGTSQAWKLEL